MESTVLSHIEEDELIRAKQEEKEERCFLKMHRLRFQNTGTVSIISKRNGEVGLTIRFEEVIDLKLLAESKPVNNLEHVHLVSHHIY